MMPKNVYICLDGTSELPILVQSGAVKTLPHRDLDRSTSGLAVGFGFLQRPGKKRSQLSPFRLGEHWYFDSATPAVGLLWHGVKMAES
jgi:hypothetical protein